jgi:hypothetical protein
VGLEDALKIPGGEANWTLGPRSALQRLLNLLVLRSHGARDERAGLLRDAVLIRRGATWFLGLRLRHGEPDSERGAQQPDSA